MHYPRRVTTHDEADLAAIRVLEQLVACEGVEFVSTRGVSTLAAATASFLLRRADGRSRAAAFAAWLIDQVEVSDLYLDDDELEAVLRESWDRRSTASPAAVEARREDLEAMLLREPDNLDHRLVYADWLQGHRDPFGELIARQIAAQSQPDNRALARAAASDLREQVEPLFGRLAEYLDSIVRLRWRAGFVEAATLGKPLGDPGPYQGAILLRWLLDRRPTMLLRELELHPFEDPVGRDQFAELLAVLFERPRPLLRRLCVGEDIELVNDDELHHGDAGRLERLAERLPKLEQLEVHVRTATVDRLLHPTLRRLVWGAEIAPKQVASIAEFELPQLEHLGFGAGYVPEELIEALARRELPRLRALKLQARREQIGWLMGAVWREQLEVLDLSGGSLEDRDVEALARRPWPRLRRLDVSANLLGPEGVERLAGLGVEELIIGEQRSPEPEWDEDDDEYYEDSME